MIAVVAVAMVGDVACQPPAPPRPATGDCGRDPFDAQFQPDLDAFGAAAHHLTAVVLDDRTGCSHHPRLGQSATSETEPKWG